VSTTRDLGDGLEFDASFEDRDAPPRARRNGPLVYHVRVVQTSRNRYDLSQRDLAISSPVVLGKLAPFEDAPAGSAPAETTRGRELREAFERNWGYTAPGAPVPSSVPTAGPAPWRRDCGTVVPGHGVARARGFGALRDGRAVIALAESVLVVDPASGAVASFALPGGNRAEEGRAFCVADRGERGVLLRGAGPGGGWAAVLDPATGAWSAAPPRADDGTFVLDARGELVCLVARELSRPERDARWPSPVAGWLLGIAPDGSALIRTYGGRAVRVGPDGTTRGHVAGIVLAADPSGAAIVLAGLSARHAELSTAVLLSRALPDGTTEGPFRLDVRASPVAEPPLAAAFTPDGTLLLLGGSDEWRRAPGHDWWGASVERWVPVDRPADPPGGR